MQERIGRLEEIVGRLVREQGGGRVGSFHNYCENTKRLFLPREGVGMEVGGEGEGVGGIRGGGREVGMAGARPGGRK